MKSIYTIVLVAIVGLVGCVGPMQYSQPVGGPGYQSAQQPVIQGGLVPVDIQNPCSLEQEVLLFWGSSRVDIIPDPRGGWMYSRPAFKLLVVGPAHFESNWHEYVRLMLPRNSSFILAGQTMNGWGKGSPYFVGFSTGPNPFSYRYTMVMPSYPTAEAGGLVTLQFRPIMPFGPALNLHFTIDVGAIGISGRPIANGVTNLLY